MKGNFEKALAFVLKWEGEKTERMDDPGGLTIFGISIKSFPDKVLEMEALLRKGKKEEAKKIAEEIYRNEFWIKSDCENLPFPLDIAVFDTAVNMGRTVARELLNKSGGDFYKFLLLRIQRYVEIVKKKPTLRTFLLGWLNRVLDLFTSFAPVAQSDRAADF